jgi:hypothetical protein
VNKVLRTVCGPRRKELTDREGYIIRTFIIFIFRSVTRMIKSRRTRQAGY